MKLLDKDPKPVVRIQVDDRVNSTSSSITLEKTTVSEVVEFIQNIANKTNQTLGFCVSDKPTSIRVQVFNAESQKRSNVKSFTIYNITPSEYTQKIINEIENQE